MKRFQIIYPLVGLAFWLGTWFLAGCSDDTGSLSGQTPEEELIPVIISIGVDDAEKLFTRAEGDENEGGEEATPEEPTDPNPDEPTTPSYTANTITDDAKVGDDLVVYIMGRDNLTLNRTDFTYEETANRYVAEVRLYRGSYQAYAFANHTGFNLTLPDAIKENPAVDAISLVSETNGIPMSGEAKWEVNAAGEYKVELVRMVGRMDVTIADERGEDSDDGNIESVEISNLLPAQTSLLRESKGAVTLPSSITDLTTWSWPSFTLGDDDRAETSFYLHETGTSGEGFQLSVTFDGGNPRGTTLRTQVIPRNYTFPLHIYIRDYVLDINITTEVPPIGGIPTSKPGEIGRNYDITVPEGCTFTIKATFKKNGQATSTSWEYELEDETDKRIKFNIPTSTNPGETFEFSGTVTSVPYGGREVINTITLTVTDELSTGEQKTVSFPLQFYIRALKDDENSTTTTRSASSEMQPVIVEL